jgi:hypothetical protein
MRNLLFGAAAATLLAASQVTTGAQAAPVQLISGVYHPGEAPALEPVQFFYGGQTYCWYPGGWRGAGFYWCGYAYRQGLGWGGGAGWNGWRGGGRGGSGGGGHMAGAVHTGSARSSSAFTAGGHGGGGHAAAGHSTGGHAGAGGSGGGHAGGGGKSGGGQQHG